MKVSVKILALILSLCMIICMSACGGTDTTESGLTNNDTQSDAVSEQASTPNSSATDDDDFFSDSVESIDNGTGTTNNGGSGGSTGNSGNGGNSGSAGNSGTNQNSGSNSSKAKTWKQVLAGMPSNLKGTTVKLYNWNSISEYPGAAKAIESFTKSTGIKVQWITENYNTYLSKLTNLVASGDSPDLIRLRNPLPTSLTNVQPLSVSGFDFNDAAWDKYTKESYTIGGKVYGANLANTHLASPLMIIYNKSLISKYDLDDPYTLWKKGKWTYDTFINLCKEFKDESGEDYAFFGFQLEGITSMYGVPGSVKYNGTKYVSIANDANFIKATQIACDLVNTQKIYKDAYDSESLESGKFLMMSGSGVLARRLNAYFQNLKATNSLGFVPNPTVDGKESPVYFQEFEAYGIAKGAKNAKAAPYFLRYFLDSANYDMNAFFSNAQAKEVYDYQMSRSERLWSTGYEDATDFTGTTDTGFIKKVYASTSSQVKSIIDQNKALVDTRAKNLNDILAKIK